MAGVDGGDGPEERADGDGPEERDGGGGPEERAGGDGPEERAGHRDALPADLDVTALGADYVVPDNSRRRWAGAVHLVAAVIAAGVAVAAGGSSLVNGGVLAAAALLGAIGVYHLVAGVPLGIREVDALAAASRHARFPVGHASAQLGWRGLLSRPTWRILLYSTEEPPAKRGFVLVDAVSGEVVDGIVEDNPEDWAAGR